MMDRLESEPYAVRPCERNEDGSIDETTGCTRAEMDWPEISVLQPITRKVARLTAPEFQTKEVA